MGTWGEFISRDFDNTHFEMDIPSIKTDLDGSKKTTSLGCPDYNDRFMNKKVSSEKQLASTDCAARIPAVSKARGWSMCDGCNHCDENGDFSDGDCDRLVVDLPSPLRTKECCQRSHTNSERTVGTSPCVKAISLSLGCKDDHNGPTVSTKELYHDRQDSTLPGTVVKHVDPSFIDRTNFTHSEYGFTVETFPTSHNKFTCPLAESKTPTVPWSSSRQLSSRQQSVEFTGENIPESPGTQFSRFRKTSKSGTSYRRILPKPPVTGELCQQLSQFSESLHESLVSDLTGAAQVPDKVFAQFKDKLVPRFTIGQPEFRSSLPEESSNLDPRVSTRQSSEFGSPLSEDSTESTSTVPGETERQPSQFKETSVPGNSVRTLSEIEAAVVTRPPDRQIKRNYFYKTNPNRKVTCSKLIAPSSVLSRRAKSLMRLSAEEAEKRRRRTNEQERVRQRDIAEAFDALRRLEMPQNPDVPNKDDSKMYLLKTAAGYIAALMKMIEDFDMGLLRSSGTAKTNSSRMEISADSTLRDDCKPIQDCKSNLLLPTQNSSKPTLPVPKLSNTILSAGGSSNNLPCAEQPIQHRSSTHPDVRKPFVVPYGVVHPHPTIPMVAPVHHIDPRAFMSCDPIFNVYSSMSTQVGFLSPIPNPGFMNPAASPVYSPAYYPLLATPQNMFYSQDNLLMPLYTAAPGGHRPASALNSPNHSSQVLDLTNKELTPGVQSSPANRTFDGRLQTLHSTPQQNNRSSSDLLEASFPNSTPIRPVSSVTNPTTPNSIDLSSSSKNTTGGSSGYLSLTSPLPQRDSRCFSPDRLNQTMDEMYNAYFPKHSPKQRLTFVIS